MSGLNLIPDPQSMATHTVIFLSNIYVVKKMMIEPFLQLKTAREQQTIDAEHGARQMEQELSVNLLEVEKRLKSVSDDVRQDRDNHILMAKKEKEQNISTAQKEVEKLLSEMRAELARNFEEEKGKIRQNTVGLMGQIYADLLR
ncbi:MAG: hypothetical protein HYW48_12505 [Deltaproteobacteria bacterium]|nr:hypothetical protein [Deltaproteobacteria bacterium]